MSEEATSRAGRRASEYLAWCCENYGFTGRLFAGIKGGRVATRGLVAKSNPEPFPCVPNSSPFGWDYPATLILTLWPATPSERKIKHSLAVSELYVELVERSHRQGFTITRFDVETSYATGTGWLSPDAYAVIAAGDVVDNWWIEVDRATESVATVRRKIEAYATYYQQGRWSELGIMPRLLVTVPNDRRQAKLLREVKNDAALFTTVCLCGTATDHITQALTNPHS